MYGECSVSCGGGSRMRFRQCLNGMRMDIGCEGADEEEEICNERVRKFCVAT